MNNDGVCDDGATVAASGGDVDAETSVCDFGTDATDCGLRCFAFPPPPSPPPPSPPRPPPLPPSTIAFCVPQSGQDEARARCLERSFDLQVCSVEQTDRLHHDASALTPSSEVSVFVTSYHTAVPTYVPSSTSGNCDSLADMHLIRSESECRDAAFREGVEFFENTGYLVQRPMGCYVAVEVSTQRRLYAAYNSDPPAGQGHTDSSAYCGFELTCSEDPLAHYKCSFYDQLVIYECICRSGADELLVAPAYACYFTLDSAQLDAGTATCMAANEQRAHDLCASRRFVHGVRSRKTIRWNPFSERRTATQLAWDGLTQQDADNGYELWADPDATTLHCRDRDAIGLHERSVYMRRHRRKASVALLE